MLDAPTGPTVPAPAPRPPALAGPSVAAFTTADCFRWIYSMFSWQTSRLLYPIVNVAQWVSYGFNWTWAWINANGVYTFKFQEWLVHVAADLWNVRTRPVLGTLNDVCQGYRRYCLEVADALLVQLRAIVLGTVFSLLSAVGVSQTVLQLLHDGMQAARAPFLRLADQLDAQLFALESRVSVGSRVIVGKINELVPWVNHYAGPGGLVPSDVFAWSLSVWFQPTIVTLLGLVVRPDWQARTAALIAKMPPSDYPATVAAVTNNTYATNPDYQAVVAAFYAGNASKPTAT